MGIRERQQRERESVRHAILDAARTLFTEQGYQHVSIRRIAERIEYSPAAIYSYFDSKDAIFFALAEEGFGLLVEMGFALPEADSPLETLQARLMGLYHFTERYPEHFALMFLDRTVPRIRDHREQFAGLMALREQMVEVVRQCIRSGALPATVEPYAALRLLLTSVHGACVARLCQRLAPGESGEALARDALTVLIAGLQAGARMSFKATLCGLPTPAPQAEAAS